MHDDVLEPYWPIRLMRERDCYFYQQESETFGPDGSVIVRDHGQMLMLGSYSYLGLNGHPRINEAARDAIARYGTGGHGVRLLAGTLEVHKSLEACIARFKRTEAALTFSSGYITNLSTIASLVGRNDTVICDKLNHASIVDGCRISRANLVRFRHNDMDDLESCLKEAGTGGRKLVVVDAVFSMDGDIIDLPRVTNLCRRYHAWLMVDEAHAIGVLGRTGRGIEEHFGLPDDSIDIKMGTFSKAIPSSGGYIAASQRLCEFLAHQARGFIYSAALSPVAAAAAQAALEVIEQEPDRVARLQANIRHFGDGLRAAGFFCPGGETPIFPILCGSDWDSYALARHCRRRGIYVQAIPHPVVPKGTARLRASVCANHKHEDLDFCISVLREGAEELEGPLNRNWAEVIQYARA
jgi:glycine C-acetyltransferase